MCGARANGDSPTVNYNSYGGYNPYGYQPVDTQPSKLLAVLSFIFWWIGLAVWIFCRHTRPGKAGSALKGMLSSFSVSMPFIGAIFWVLWKDDPTKKDYAKVGGVSAIVGACMYLVLIIGSIVLTLTGAAEAGWYVPLYDTFVSTAKLV